MSLKYGIVISVKNKATVILETGRFDDVDSTAIISSVSKPAQNMKNCRLVLRCLAYTFDDDI